MRRFLAVLLIFGMGAALSQTPDQAAKPTPEEVAFARLPADFQQMLAGLTPAQAMQQVAQAQQHAIALGVPRPTHEQLRGQLRSLLDYSTYTSASAGGSSFPPLSPLVAPPPPPFLR